MAGKVLAPVLKIAVSVFLIWLVFRNIDWRDVGSRMFDIPIGRDGAVALAMFIVQYRGVRAAGGARSCRRSGADMSFGQALSFFWIGTFFNQALPSSVGGDARTHLQGLQGGGAGSRWPASGVLLERCGRPCTPWSCWSC